MADKKELTKTDSKADSKPAEDENAVSTETVPGGKYLVKGKLVDADGKAFDEKKDK